MTTIGPERVDNMLSVLRQWQGLERQSMETTTSLLEETRNPLLRLLMEIIRHDSLMHHRVQQFLIDSLTDTTLAVSREDVAEIWQRIEEHDHVEKRTVELARTLRAGAWSPVHAQLLDYLLQDEAKHEALLERLNEIKAGMSRASGG